ncbi:hypothetical protein [Vulcanococcus limneticus]|uniref:hypothetical protein n=1 Tax=Vulcanococcus limneticus TaxID=2170428 RepID=UPI00398BFACF
MKKKGQRLQRYFGLRREAGMAWSGGIEHLLPGQISGWVVAKGVPLQEVRLLVGHHLIARAEINQARPDVCEKLGWQGTPGFSLVLPAELPPVDWQPAPRLLAISADASQQVELGLIGKPQQTAGLLKALLQSDLLGLEGHVDGLLQGALRGWAGRRGQGHPAHIWLQAAGQEPLRLNCNQWRDGLLAMGLPERSGFQLDPMALPPSWGGLEAWCSFDPQGQFRLPQLERVVLPAGPAVGGEVMQAIQTSASLTPGNLPPMQEWPTGVPDDLRHHWQALENFRLYLDKVEQKLEARDNSRQQAPAPKVSGLPGWWPHLLGGGR